MTESARLSSVRRNIFSADGVIKTLLSSVTRTAMDVAAAFEEIPARGASP